jgi:hypothetical protein
MDCATGRINLELVMALALPFDSILTDAEISRSNASPMDLGQDATEALECELWSMSIREAIKTVSPLLMSFDATIIFSNYVAGYTSFLLILQYLRFCGNFGRGA